MAAQTDLRREIWTRQVGVAAQLATDRMAQVRGPGWGRRDLASEREEASRGVHGDWGAACVWGAGSEAG